LVWEPAIYAIATLLYPVATTAAGVIPDTQMSRNVSGVIKQAFV
jgi:hypothetical protein